MELLQNRNSTQNIVYVEHILDNIFAVIFHFATAPIIMN